MRAQHADDLLHRFDSRTHRLLEYLDHEQVVEDPQFPTGVFTMGIVSTQEGRKIALFFSGRKHAGENLADVLAQRAVQLPRPIQMCDALSRNLPQELEVILANCLTHYLDSVVTSSKLRRTFLRNVVKGGFEIVELNMNPHAMLVEPFVQELAAKINVRLQALFTLSRLTT